MSFVGCVQLLRSVEQSIRQRRLRKRWRNRIHSNARGCELRRQGTSETLNGSLCSSDRGVEGHTGLHCHRTKQDDGRLPRFLQRGQRGLNEVNCSKDIDSIVVQKKVFLHPVKRLKLNTSRAVCKPVNLIR